ncbi:uncharacterized protein LOC106658483 [Trichogramma pretiosum]|uniref:uncharacterized protein LOC106658483 n=1 Tax=Trichogramma pretiosum TaxID=7493 RepID=UPI000C71A234|nr:uncharacterized protein LOC106658483 [Trichogramma pretiosum]
MAKVKKHYKLFFSANYNPRNVSRWTRNRWAKILLKHNETLKLRASMKSGVSTNDEMNANLITNSNDHNIIEQYDNAMDDQNCHEINENSVEEINESLDYSENHCRVVFDSDDDDSDSDEEFLNGDVENPKDSNKHVVDDRTMFPSSGCTVTEVITMLNAFIIKFNPTKKLQDALIELVKVLAGEQFKTWNYNSYRIKKQLNPSPGGCTKHFYCEKCNEVLLSIESSKKIDCTVECSSCGDEIVLCHRSKNFITLKVKNQLETLLNRPDIQEHMRNFVEERETYLEDGITDVQDSLKYKQLQMAHPGALTFNFNTDGAQLFNSSKKSLWPLQLYINELPPEIRFKHIIIAALMETESEPTAKLMNLYMKELVEEMQQLREEGVQIINSLSGEVEYVSIMPFTGNVDTVARPKLQNRIQFNGAYGCSWCYHPGIWIDGSMRYVLQNEDAPLRSHVEHVSDMKFALESNKSIRGVKGESILLSLSNFDIVWDLPPDYMHGTLLGVTKQLLNKWLSIFLKKKELEKIKTRMLNIKLCRDIRRSIRPLEFSGKYKATEWRNWLLFVSLPALKDILPPEEFLSYCYLVDSIYRLLKAPITPEDLRRVEYNLLKFVGESEMNYGRGFVTFNLHSLNHLYHAVQQTGPLWATSAFPFENGIYLFMKEINAPNGCLQH